jgi:TusA-related sulfurtransferase
MKRLFLLFALAALLATPLIAADAAKPMACCAKAAGVEHTVANLDNGVKITITAKDAKAVAMIQDMAASCCKDKECCKDCPMMAKGVTRTVEKTASGVVITATASDPALVKKLQEYAAACTSGAMKGCCKGKASHAGACLHEQHNQPFERFFAGAHAFQTDETALDHLQYRF